MAKRKTYPLLIYRRIIRRWRATMLWLGIALLGASGALALHPLSIEQPWRLQALFGLTALVFGVTIFLHAIRNAAYVQLASKYLRIATPFLRLNVSYKRIKRTFSAETSKLFPLDKVGRLRRKLVRPYASYTAIVVALTDFPIPKAILKAFLSPLFFANDTPHFVLILEDWMGFSVELDSLRSGAKSPTTPASTPNSRLLASLRGKKRK